MTYKVVYQRDPDGWWIARVVGVAGVHSNGRTIDEARRRVREALSLAVDDADTAEFTEDVRLPSELRRLVREQREARALATDAQRRATGLQAEAARRLAEDLKLSLRDIGALLGVSHQMIKKLADNRETSTKSGVRELGGASVARDASANKAHRQVARRTRRATR